MALVLRRQTQFSVDRVAEKRPEQSLRLQVAKVLNESVTVFLWKWQEIAVGTYLELSIYFTLSALACP